MLNLPTTQTSPLKFMLAENDQSDAVAGTFGAIVLPAGFTATVDYAFIGLDSLGRTGDGNDIAVTLTFDSAPPQLIEVPEPSTCVLLAGLAAIAALSWRQHRLSAVRQ